MSPDETPPMAWRFGQWRAEHALPVGVVERVIEGDAVRAGDVVAAGTILGTASRLDGARRIGVATDDLPRVLRVPVGAQVRGGTIIARTGRRFARAVTAPADGRVVQLSADGDVYFAPVVGQWAIRAALGGAVTRSDESCVTVEGDAWCLQGIAAFGPDAVGELTLSVSSGEEELAPSRLDVRLGGRIIVGGARASAEAMTRAHACGVAGLVAGAANAAGLRVVYGQDVSAAGAPGRDDRPTMLCLLGFGAAQLPAEVFDPLRELAGSRAAIHTASARLFVFAASDVGSLEREAPLLALAHDYGAVRAVGAAKEVGERVFASEAAADAVRVNGDLIPARNLRVLGLDR